MSPKPNFTSPEAKIDELLTLLGTRLASDHLNAALVACERDLIPPSCMIRALGQLVGTFEGSLDSPNALEPNRQIYEEAKITGRKLAKDYPLFSKAPS